MFNYCKRINVVMGNRTHLVVLTPSIYGVIVFAVYLRDSEHCGMFTRLYALNAKSR